MKKISLIIVASLMITGAFVYGNSNNTENDQKNCPNRIGCICEPNTKLTKVETVKIKTENCPNKPGCICN